MGGGVGGYIFFDVGGGSRVGDLWTWGLRSRGIGGGEDKPCYTK